MNKLISNFIFLLQKPKVTIITGEGRQCTKEAIFQVLNQHFKIGKDILVFETDLNDSEKFEFLAKNSSLPVLVATQIGDALSDKIRKLAEILPTQGYLVFNFDDETTRGIKDGINAKTFSFGLQEKADFFASDIKINGSTNFKVNYHGNIVPIWQRALFAHFYNSFFGKKLNFSFGRHDICSFWFDKTGNSLN